MNLRTVSLLGILVLSGVWPAIGESWLSFDGVDDRVTVPYHASFPTEVFTIAAEIKLLPPSRRAAVIARGEDDNSFNLSWQLYVQSDGRLEIMLENDRETNFCYPQTCMGQPQPTCSAGDVFVADDVWHHVAATRNASGSLSLFVDGTERVRCTGTGVPSSNNFQDLTIGSTFGSIGPLAPGETEPPTWFFPGQIDNPAVWSTVLGQSQLETVAANGPGSSPATLAGFWEFEEGAGQSVVDSSGTGNHGRLGADIGPDAADPSWVVEPTEVLPPAAPSNLSAVPISVSMIDLAWTDNALTEESFVIDRRPTGGQFAGVASVPANVTTWTDIGLVPTSDYQYRVSATNVAGSSAFSNVAAATTLDLEECVESGGTLCLNQGRFSVQVQWRDFGLVTGNGIVALRSPDSGLFWFFASDNWEVMVKVLDACGFNNRFWVFASATTNVEYTLRVTDTQTAVTREYFNPLGTAATAITDTDAFAACP